MSEYGLYVTSEYSTISDDVLNQLIMRIKQEFPTCGNKQMLGHLVSRGYRVQQVRVREAMRRVDPEGSIMRRLSSLNRRQYTEYQHQDHFGTLMEIINNIDSVRLL